jgi:hypothetical protein
VGLTRLLCRASSLRQNEGVATMLRRGLDKLFVFGSTPWEMLRFSGRSFQIQQYSFEYVIHRYNATWRNERAVELALASRFIKFCGSERLLEVGNVTGHYMPSKHVVIDKYESSPGILNIDVLDFNPTRTFDTLVSISTLEHVGWDEPKREPFKVEKAFRRLEELLGENGRWFVTFPLGYNAHLDQMVQGRDALFENLMYMQRLDHPRRWVECSRSEALQLSTRKEIRGTHVLALLIRNPPLGFWDGVKV